MCFYKRFAVLMLCTLGTLFGCGQTRSGVSTRCEVGLSEVSREDIPSAVASPAQSRSSQPVVYYRSAILDGVCLDAMTQHYGRSIDVTVFGESPEASSGSVNQLIFPGLRQLAIPLIRDQADCAVAQEESNQRRQISALSCRKFFYYASNISGLAKTGSHAAAAANRAMELPWSDIDVSAPQYIYAAVLMPAGYVATQRPSTVTLRFETLDLP